MAPSAARAVPPRVQARRAVMVRHCTGTDVHAGIAFDAQRYRFKHGLDITVETALNLHGRSALASKPSSTSDVRGPCGSGSLSSGAACSILRRAAGLKIIGVGSTRACPSCDCQQVDARSVCRSVIGFGRGNGLMNGDCRLVTVFHGPDDVLRAQRPRRHQRRRPWRVDSKVVRDRQRAHPTDRTRDPCHARSRERHFPVRWRAPRRRRGMEFLADQQFGLIDDALPSTDVVLHEVKAHADKLAVLEHEFLGRVIDDNFDPFSSSASSSSHSDALKKSARLTRHDLDVVSRTEAQRRPATVHGRVAHTDNQHAFADRFLCA